VNSFAAVVSYNPDAPSFCLQEAQGFQEPSPGLGLTELPAVTGVLNGLPASLTSREFE